MLDDGPECSICGGRRFVASAAGRIAKNGQPPKCAGCNSLERHRIARRIYDALPDEELNGQRVLQFSDDQAAPRQRFGSVEISVFSDASGLDITKIDRPDAVYDWAIANHVLEHVEDDAGGLKELLRVVKPSGVVQIMVPTPSSQLWTEDWGFADPEAYGHYRGYGSDLPFVLSERLGDAAGIQAIAWDTVIPWSWDVVYFFSASRARITRLGAHLLSAGIPVLAAA